MGQRSKMHFANSPEILRKFSARYISVDKTTNKTQYIDETVIIYGENEANVARVDYGESRQKTYRRTIYIEEGLETTVTAEEIEGSKCWVLTLHEADSESNDGAKFLMTSKSVANEVAGIIRQILGKKKEKRNKKDRKMEPIEQKMHMQTSVDVDPTEPDSNFYSLNNSIYDSTPVKHFDLEVGSDEMVQKLKLPGKKCSLIIHDDVMKILSRDERLCVTWPIRHIRRFGKKPGVVTLEAGRKCEAGPGQFSFRTTVEGDEEALFRVIRESTKMVRDRKDAETESATPDTQHPQRDHPQSLPARIPEVIPHKQHPTQLPLLDSQGLREAQRKLKPTSEPQPTHSMTSSVSLPPPKPLRQSARKKELEVSKKKEADSAQPEARKLKHVDSQEGAKPEVRKKPQLPKKPALSFDGDVASPPLSPTGTGSDQSGGRTSKEPYELSVTGYPQSQGTMYQDVVEQKQLSHAEAAGDDVAPERPAGEYATVVKRPPVATARPERMEMPLGNATLLPAYDRTSVPTALAAVSHRPDEHEYEDSSELQRGSQTPPPPEVTYDETFRPDPPRRTGGSFRIRAQSHDEPRPSQVLAKIRAGMLQGNSNATYDHLDLGLDTRLPARTHAAALNGDYSVSPLQPAAEYEEISNVPQRRPVADDNAYDCVDGVVEAAAAMKLPECRAKDNARKKPNRLKAFFRK